MQNLTAIRQLYDKVEAVKRVLSTDFVYCLEIDSLGGFGRLWETVTCRLFKDLNLSLFHETIAVTRKVIQNASFTVDDVEEVNFTPLSCMPP